MTEIRVENVYSNIDPVTGGVAISERVMQQSRNEYFQMTSSSHLPYGHSYASGGEWVHRGGFKKKVQHLLTWNFLLKIVEIVLLIACASLYTNRLHQVLNTTGTMIMPCATYLSLFLITTCIAVCVAVKGRVSNLFTVSFHTMAVLLLFVSGGVIFGMWYSMPRKVKSTFFWEAVMMLSQISLSFLVGVVYLADLALSLDAVNKRR